MPALRSVVVSALALLGAAVPALATNPKVIQVKTPSQLQSAFASVPDGGVIELAAGTYAAPAKAFNISNPKKGFTVRAAAGAAVVLDGQGKGTILRYRNTDRTKGKLVTFQGITFQNGLSTAPADAGAVSLNYSAAAFVGCTFRNNASGNRAGAIAVVFSSLTIQGGAFIGNRTNRPGHKPTSPGGAIYALDSTVTVSDARFENNEAGWTGGAIYAFGLWSDPVTTPKSLVTVTRSTFLGNRAAPDPCCGQGEPTAGGAIHVEDQTTLRVLASHFLDNAADNGGAIDAFRAVVEVSNSIFLGNRTPVVAGRLGVGGAIAVASNDSTSDPVNRRTGRLTVTDSLLQGGVAPPATSANQGGCIAAEGDWVRLYGSAPMGTPADNRAPVELRRVAFVDCDVQKSPTAGGGFGGAVAVATADLILDGSLIFASDARVDSAAGGGLSIQRESTALINGTTFAQNSAARAGGALYLNGSAAQVTASRFFRNAVDESRGSAVFAIPQLGNLGARDTGGLVAGSVLSENTGIPFWDAENQGGPVYNEVRYDGNQVYGANDRIYAHTVEAPSGTSAAVLNSMVLYHPGRAPLDKGNGNSRIFSLPVQGALVAAPASLGTGAPAATVTFLAYAWSGRSASIDGQVLTDKAGILPVSGAGSHTLTVDGTAVATVQVAATAPLPRPR
jgi:predicted outer membrane repeat protein